MSSGTTGTSSDERNLAGVDGCHAGWIAAIHRAADKTIGLAVEPTFAKMLERIGQSALVVVDIPIGLLDERRRGGRLCDVEARRLLGKRRSSVFNPPSRDALSAESYDDARRFGLSQQGFAIVPKIREVDDLMTAAMQDRVIESHPELAFTNLAGQPMTFNKKKSDGLTERLEALKLAADLAHCWQRGEINDQLANDRARFLRRDVATDDIVDAYVMLCVAARVAAGEVRRVPADPPVDSKGLRMEMWY